MEDTVETRCYEPRPTLTETRLSSGSMTAVGYLPRSRANNPRAWSIFHAKIIWLRMNAIGLRHGGHSSNTLVMDAAMKKLINLQVTDLENAVGQF